MTHLSLAHPPRLHATTNKDHALRLFDAVGGEAHDASDTVEVEEELREH